MSVDIERSAASTDLVNRRLAGGVLLSVLFHALLLSLQFGMPGLGTPSPSTPPPITIVLAPPAPAPAQAAVAEPILPSVPAPTTGMQVVDPLPPAPAAPVVAKAKPSRPRRISRPLPPREPVASPTRVIAQDQNPDDTFVMPLPQPEESVQKTVDPKEAQEGDDDGSGAQAALLAEEKQKQELAGQLAAEAQAERERQALLRAEKRAEEESRRQAEARMLQEQQLRAAQQQADQLAAQQKTDQLALRQKTEELAQRQKADELAQRQKADELAFNQKAEQQAARQRAEDLARQQAEQLARQQAEQLARQQAEQLARQQAEQLARQQAEQLARQQAEQLARQQAEQAARQQAEQAARQQAEQTAQRDREQAASAGAGAKAAGSGGTGVTVPKNMFGSDAGNRVRELTRGIDLLSGDPPQRPRAGDGGAGRRVVVGAGERDVPLRMYVESFRQKVERNGGMAVSPTSGQRPRTDPLVSVAIRSDGSVEDVTIVRSSGHADVDNAVRRIVRVNARYSAFPPNVAEKYDVIEIRRIWSFADSLTLMEELR